MAEPLRVFVDESSQNAHAFSVLGATVVDPGDHDLLVATIEELALRADVGSELKWGRVSRAHLGLYRDVVDLCFNRMRTDALHFNALVYETKQANHSRFNSGVPDIGFNKLIYQLLLHKVGLRYGEHHPIHVFVDQRTTSQAPERLAVMLNAALARDHAIDTSPFKRITFADSKKLRLIQTTDLLTGAIAYRKNGWHRAPGASPARAELAEHIARSCLQVQRKGPLDRGAVRFTLWNFKHRSAA